MALTLIGQGPNYWSGYRGRPNEANPAAWPLLRYHPLAFLAGGIGWVVAFCLLILILPRRLSLWAWLAVVMGHTWGMTTWVRTLCDESVSYWMCLGICAAVSGAAAIQLRMKAEG